MSGLADLASTVDAVALSDRSSNQDAQQQSLTDAPKQGLADMPAAWLQQVLDILDLVTLLALFKACRAMRDRVLSQSYLRLRFELPIPLGKHTSAAQNSLLVACQHSECIHLQLVPPHGRANIKASSNGTSGRSLMAGFAKAASVQGLTLTALKSVHLEGMELDVLVPSWLTSTCPHMTSLQLHRCQFKVPLDPTVPAACSQLQQVHLHNHHNFSQLRTLQNLHEQLRRLPALNSLGLAQPSHLKLWVQHCPEMRTLLDTLSELSLGAALVTDYDMPFLLSMPSLKRLQCGGFRLQHSHPCPWTQLRFQELHVDSFALLPLEGVKSLQIAAPDQVATVRTSRDPAVTDRVVAAISKCGGLQWGRLGRVVVQGSGGRMELGPAQQAGDDYMAVMPILGTCPASNFSLEMGMVTSSLLEAIRRHLTSAKLSHIVFRVTTFTASAWSALLTSLPPSVRQVQFQEFITVGGAAMSVALLAEMCSAACQPIMISVCSGGVTLGARWEQRVQAAMAAGHQFVQLVNG